VPEVVGARHGARHRLHVVDCVFVIVTDICFTTWDTLLPVDRCHPSLGFPSNNHGECDVSPWEGAVT